MTEHKGRVRSPRLRTQRPPRPRTGHVPLAMAAIVVAIASSLGTRWGEGARVLSVPRSALPSTSASSSPATAGTSTRSRATSDTCGSGRWMTVHFYDVGQGLSVLVDLPDGRRVLVDTGDSPRRSGCGEACADADQHLMDSLRADLGGAPISLLWITHQHSDHIGGAPAILETFHVETYVDNGCDPRKPEVLRARRTAEKRGAAVFAVDPAHPRVPIAGGPDLTLSAIVPRAWPSSCASDPNDCSIGLRIDFCSSSVLFTGDTEHGEEPLFDPGGPVTLLQVAHHGSDTSTTPAFLTKARPKYAVISAGKPGQGTNREYCHPRALVVERLSRLLGAGNSQILEAFDGERCDRAKADDWVPVAASDRLWATERDGDVVLTTAGDGNFSKL